MCRVAAYAVGPMAGNRGLREILGVRGKMEGRDLWCPPSDATDFAAVPPLALTFVCPPLPGWLSGS